MVTVNGKTYKGDNLVINNNKVYIDGKLVDETTPQKVTWRSMLIALFGIAKEHLMTIEITGDVKINAVDSNIRVIGDITVDSENALHKSDVTCNSLKAKGDVTCGDITADTFSANNVHCVDINTDEFNSESIECGDLNCDDLKCQHLDVKGDLNCDDITSSIINVGGDLNGGDITGNIKANEINAGSVYMRNE